MEVQKHTKRLVEEFGVVSIAELVDYPDKAPATVGAIVTNLRLRTTKKGERMAWLTLADGTGIVSNYQFYFSSKKFVESDPKIVDLVLAQLSEVDDWARGDIHAVAEQLAPAIGLSVPVVEVALKRQSYGIKPITQSVIADQQQVADTFFALGLIPKQIKISDVARRSGS